MSAAWWRFVRFGFWLLYQPFAFTYDAVSRLVSMGAWRSWTRVALTFVDAGAGRVLELAHGTGNLQLDLAAGGYDAVGYDLSPQMGRIARRKLMQAGYPAQLARGRAQALPFASDAFAAVIATFPTDFIADPRTLAEVRRVLRPDGVLVIVPGAAFTGGGALRWVLDAAYRITGQGTVDAGALSAAARADMIAQMEAMATAQFAPHGFDVRVALVDCPRSVAMVIVAHNADSAGGV